MNKKTIIGLCLLFAVIIGAMCALIPAQRDNEFRAKWGVLAELAETDSRVEYITSHEEDYPAELLDYLRTYADEEYIEWVYQYPFHKDDYADMEYTADELNSPEVPALYMDDPRWGYQQYEGGYIKTDGCVCVSMTMAYVYLTHDSSFDPYKIALLAEEHGAVGFFGGVDYDLIRDICADMGLKCTVSEKYFTFEERFGTPAAEELRSIIDSGHVCMLGLSGETFGSHALIVRGYDEQGFYLNDPADRDNSARPWTFDELRDEIVMIYDIWV